MATVIFVDHQGNPLSGIIKTSDFRGRKVVRSQLNVGKGGSCEIPESLVSNRVGLEFCPDNGFWTTAFKLDGEKTLSVECATITDEGKEWPYKLLSFNKGGKRWSANGSIKIGIIDSFSKNRKISNLPYLHKNIEFLNPVPKQKMDFYEDVPHGEVVLQTLIHFFEHIDMDVEFYLYDITVDFFPYVSLSEYLIGMELLTKKGVNIINFSGGIFSEDTPNKATLIAMKRRVETATRQGIICVAAAGNDPKKNVAIPSALESSFGVGSFGLASNRVYPTGSHPADIAAYALERKEVCQIQSVGPVFCDPGCTFGEEVDLVAPGLGVPIMASNKKLRDWRGSSFASPLATGLLAAVIGYHGKLAGQAKSDVLNLKSFIKRCSDKVYHSGKGLDIAVPTLTKLLENDIKL